MKLTKLEIKRFIYATLGLLVLAVSINILSWQFKLVSGGLPGYALALNYVFDINVGILLIVLNTIALLFNTIILGKKIGIKSIYGYVIFSIFIEITRDILGIQQTELDNQTYNMILIIIQGIIAPIGISISLINGYSFGGWSSLFQIIEKYTKKISAPQFFFIMDIILSIFVSITFGIYVGVLVAINSIVFFYSFRIIYKRLNKL